MIEKDLEKEIIQYCQDRGIIVIRGKIPSRHTSEIKEFIARRLKREKATTERKEEEGKLKISAQDLTPFLGNNRA